MGPDQAIVFVARAAAIRVAAPHRALRDTAASHAEQTGADERTLRRRADQFEAEGLLSFLSKVKIGCNFSGPVGAGGSESARLPRDCSSPLEERERREVR